MTNPKEPRREAPLASVLEAHPEHVKAIGMIGIEISTLEICLGELLGSILHVGAPYGRIVYLTPKANLARLEILENVYKNSLYPGTKTYVAVEKVCGKAKALIGQRHQIVHHSWGTSVDDPETVVRRPLPYKDTTPPKPVPLSDLEDMVERIRNLISDAIDLTDALYEFWPPYEKPPIQIRQSEFDRTRKPDSPQTETDA